MNVLIFQGWVDPQGRPPHELLDAWPTLAGVAGAVASAGARVEVVVASRHHERVEKDGVVYHFVREPRRPAPRRVLGHRAAPHPYRALAHAASRSSDVIHLHGLSFPRQAAALRRAHPSTPILAQDHADRPPVGWRRSFHRRGFRALDGVAFTDRALASPFLDAAVLPSEVAIYEVVEGSSDFAPPASRAAGAGPWRLVTVGGLSPGKDPGTVLEAVALASDRGVDLRLRMIFRGGSLEGAMRDRVRTDRRLSGRVELVGSVEHRAVEAELARADLLISASHFEGSGFAVIEALACATPVVLSDIAAHRALLGGAPCGVLVPPGDAGALADAVLDFLPSARSARVAARARFEEALSYPVIGRTLVAAYSDLLERTRARRSAGERSGP